MSSSVHIPPDDVDEYGIGQFHDALHANYIIELGRRLDSSTSYEGAVTEHLRMSGVYWSLGALSLLRDESEVDACMGLNRGMMVEGGGKEKEGGDDGGGNDDDDDDDDDGDGIGIGSERTTRRLRPRRRSIVDWVFDCHDPASGGFGGNCVIAHADAVPASSSSSADGGDGRYATATATATPAPPTTATTPRRYPHDAHVLYTLSALQILAMANAMDDDRLDVDGVVRFVSGLQNDDGSFRGDMWGEVDTRFTYCALMCLALLGKLPPPPNDNDDECNAVIDVHRAARYVMSCRNFDGGFGSTPGAESHAGQVFCCIGALSIAHSLHLLNNDVNDGDYDRDNGGCNADLLAWWLAERQCDSGGLNGRPEKQADVCYSWWILSALSIIGRVGWIDTNKLGRFILNCQDDEDGGIADRPQDMPDVYHTFFGLCGLSLIGHMDKIGKGIGKRYREVDPVFALPTDVVRRLGLRAQVISNLANGDVDDRLRMHSILDGTKKR
ncbi:hypothetical protein ACHAXA_002307 [Cyclostephanos tholiformis]|uniref:protein geranylgeranyltransferase type II n=1 Tax=Cyclostephanos tholiformis TaxID=382380 RepID=A0ABD3SR45_9STRA